MKRGVRSCRNCEWSYYHLRFNERGWRWHCQHDGKDRDRPVRCKAWRRKLRVKP